MGSAGMVGRATRHGRRFDGLRRLSRIGGTSSDATLATGPIPATIASLTAGTTQQIVWTYTAGTTLGTVNFTSSVSSDQISTGTDNSNNVAITPFRPTAP